MTTKNNDGTRLQARLDKIVADISAGRIARVEIASKRRGMAREGGAVIEGKSGVPVMIDFFLYPNGRLLVRQAKATNYFGRDLSWRRSDDHGRSRDISDSFQGDIDAAMQSLKLDEVAKMPRPLRWWYLRRN